MWYLPVRFWPLSYGPWCWTEENIKFSFLLLCSVFWSSVLTNSYTSDRLQTDRQVSTGWGRYACNNTNVQTLNDPIDDHHTIDHTMYSVTWLQSIQTNGHDFWPTERRFASSKKLKIMYFSNFLICLTQLECNHVQCDACWDSFQ